MTNHLPPTYRHPPTTPRPRPTIRWLRSRFIPPAVAARHISRCCVSPSSQNVDFLAPPSSDPIRPRTGDTGPISGDCRVCGPRTASSAHKSCVSRSTPCLICITLRASHVMISVLLPPSQRVQRECLLESSARGDTRGSVAKLHAATLRMEHCFLSARSGCCPSRPPPPL